MAGEGRVRVLHVDDDPGFLDVTSEFLERADDRITVTTATSGAEALERLADASIDCVVSDYDMPGRNGIDLLEAVRDRWPDLPFLLFTGKGSEEVAGEAISAGVTDYLQKGGTEQYEILANRIDNAVEARRSAIAADRRRERLESILKTVPGCVVQLDPEGNFVFANERAEAVLGLSPEALTDRTYDDPAWELQTLDGEPVPPEEFPFERVRRAGEPMYGFQHTIRWPDGTRRTLLMNGAPLCVDEALDSVVFSIVDVTDRVRREAALTAFQEVADELAACDSMEAVCERTVAASDEILAFDVSVVSLADDDRLSAVAASDDSSRGSFSVDEGVAGRAFRTGEPVIVDDVADDEDALETTPFRSALTVPIGEFGVFQAAAVDPGAFDEADLELTELLLIHTTNAFRRLDRERRLRRQNDRLEEFASLVTHDLRTPLTVARGRLELAADECTSDHLSAVADALDHSESLIDDLSVLTRERTTGTDVESVSLGDAVTDYWNRIETGEATLSVETSQIVHADPGGLDRLVENLLRNAVEHGGRVVTVGELENGFYVADDGPGIPPADRETVFDAGYSTTDDGTGFGLRIVRRVCDAHDWDVTATDAADGGARIEIRNVTTE